MKGYRRIGRPTPAGYFLGGFPPCPILGASLALCGGLGIVLVPAVERAGRLRSTAREHQTDQHEYAEHFPSLLHLPHIRQYSIIHPSTRSCGELVKPPV